MAPGWYGKIPALGDFASRRLPQAFIDTWDAWLQNVLGASREQLGATWEEAYLGSPVWRFILLPGTCGEHGWGGVMMPSVDRVGRQFPLTIAVALDAHPDVFGKTWAATDWFDRIEDAALCCLDMESTVEALEARLSAAPFPDGPQPEDAAQAAGRQLAQWWTAHTRTPLLLQLPDAALLAQAVRDSGMQLIGNLGTGVSLWWMRDVLTGGVELHGFPGLPAAEDFVAMLAGEQPAPAAGAGPGADLLPGP
jgi:type VI secretion system protein ImpM